MTSMVDIADALVADGRVHRVADGLYRVDCGDAVELVALDVGLAGVCSCSDYGGVCAHLFAARTTRKNEREADAPAGIGL